MSSDGLWTVEKFATSLLYRIPNLSAKELLLVRRSNIVLQNLIGNKCFDHIVGMWVTLANLLYIYVHWGELKKRVHYIDQIFTKILTYSYALIWIMKGQRYSNKKGWQTCGKTHIAQKSLVIETTFIHWFQHSISNKFVFKLNTVSYKNRQTNIVKSRLYLNVHQRSKFTMDSYIWKKEKSINKMEHY